MNQAIPLCKKPKILKLALKMKITLNWKSMIENNFENKHWKKTFKNNIKNNFENHLY